MTGPAPIPSHLSLLETVCCLACGEVYSKPSAGGTASRNPGCPSCGYVGWAAVTPTQSSALRRFGAGRLPRPFAQSG